VARKRFVPVPSPTGRGRYYRDLRTGETITYREQINRRTGLSPEQRAAKYGAEGRKHVTIGGRKYATGPSARVEAARSFAQTRGTAIRTAQRSTEFRDAYSEMKMAQKYAGSSRAAGYRFYQALKKIYPPQTLRERYSSLMRWVAANK
jgi:hypothetical protein